MSTPLDDILGAIEAVKHPPPIEPDMFITSPAAYDRAVRLLNAHPEAIAEAMRIAGSYGAYRSPLETDEPS